MVNFQTLICDRLSHRASHCHHHQASLVEKSLTVVVYRGGARESSRKLQIISLVLIIEFCSHQQTLHRRNCRFTADAHRLATRGCHTHHHLPMDVPQQRAINQRLGHPALGLALG
ncbi:hypothetical protein V6N11_017943 [Hibiscus sabdariffa]|uniref:Uncharacterized protein n=1 Tax=Hibiscus sabdariffa TaxID=183260 RepID=A0ABR2T6J6_9ROSI